MTTMVKKEYSFLRGQISMKKKNEKKYIFADKTLNSNSGEELVEKIKKYDFIHLDLRDFDEIMWVTVYKVNITLIFYDLTNESIATQIAEIIDPNDNMNDIDFNTELEKHKKATSLNKDLSEGNYNRLEDEITSFLFDNDYNTKDGINNNIIATQILNNENNTPLIVIKIDNTFCHIVNYNVDIFKKIKNCIEKWNELYENSKNGIDIYTDEIWNKKVEECKAAYGLETIKKGVGDTFNQLQIALKENQLKVLQEALKAEKTKSKESDENVKKGQSELEKAKLSLIEFETQNQIKKIQSEAKFQYKLSTAKDDEKNELNASHKVDAIRDIVLEQLERMKLSTNNELLKADAKKNINQQDKQEKVIEDQKAIIEDTRTKLADTSVKRINDVVMNALENVALTAKYENDIKSATADKNTIKEKYEKEKTELGIKQIKNEVTRTLGTIVPLEMKLKEAEDNQITVQENVTEIIVEIPNENINDESKNIGNGIRFIELLVMNEMKNIPKQIELHKAKKELEKFKDFNLVTYEEYKSLQDLGLAF